jgi:hypothetical protein
MFLSCDQPWWDIWLVDSGLEQSHPAIAETDFTNEPKARKKHFLNNVRIISWWKSCGEDDDKRPFAPRGPLGASPATAEIICSVKI